MMTIENLRKLIKLMNETKDRDLISMIEQTIIHSDNMMAIAILIENTNDPEIDDEDFRNEYL